MKHSNIIKIAVYVIIPLLFGTLSFAGGPKAKPFIPEIPNEWTKMYPGSSFSYNGLSPACSNRPGSNAEFYFYAKGGTVNNLVIFFDGGGACWSSINCLYFPTYDFQLDPFLDNPANGNGIFDTDNPDNPFKDWSFVFIPYCTGDVHWGANDMEYPTTTGSWTIQHRGFVNFLAVLQWIKETFIKPHKIFVSGSSAGSYGAILNFPFIQEAFPKTVAYVLGDAGNGVVDEGFQTFYIDNWNVQIPEWIFGSDWSYAESDIADIYETIAEYYPHRKIAQYTAAGDATQIWFYNVMLEITDNPLGSPADWDNITPVVWCDWYEQMLDFAYITSETPNYRYYIAAGQDHTIMAYDKFYEEDSAGIPFVKWVKAMVKSQGGTHGHGGIPWENAECDECNLPPLPCTY